MKQLIESLLQAGKYITVTIKNSEEIYDVENVDLDKNLYTLIDGRSIYIAPDQVATIVESTKNIDEKLGF